VTNHIDRRVFEHKAGDVRAFAAKYIVRRLAYLEETSDIRAAIQREKQIKG
jgi:putative endonuclease